MMSQLRQIFVGAVVSAALFGCGGAGTANVRGKVSDQSGTQGQSQQGLSAPGLGGSGTVSAASKVTAYQIQNDGSLTAVATADVQANGTYELTVPDNAQKLIVTAQAADGHELASAIVEAAGTTGSPAVVAPMDSETSVEAKVLVQMVAQGTSVAEANAIDLRARINQQVAANVQAQASGGEDTAATIAGLARATASAQQAWIQAAAKAGVNTSQQALFNAELHAAQALDLALDAGDHTQAYSTFFTALDSAQASVGADEQTRSDAESQAGASFDLTVHAEVGASSNPGGADVADAAVRQEAVLESRLSSAAINAILAAGNAAAEAKTAATAAETQLATDVSASTTAAASATAYANFAASVTGSADLNASVLGTYLGVSGSNQTSIQAAVSAAARAQADLNTALSLALTTSMVAQSHVDPQALATAVVTAYQTYAIAVHATATNLSAFGDKAAPAASLLLTADAAFHAGS